MKKILLFILLLIPIAKAEIIITEIMANPLADESLNEFIEIYNNGTEPIDVKGWIIGDDKDNDTLEGGLYNKEGTIIPAQSYAIITDYNTRVYNNLNISWETIKLYTDDETLGNGLRNEGEKVWLYKENELIQELEYQSTGEGKTWAYSNDTWAESDPTPGYGDNIKDDIKTGCDWKVEIITNQTFIKEPEFEIKITKVYGGKNNLTLNRRIKNIFGETIKEYEPLEIEDALNYRTFDYSPNLKTGSAYAIEADINSSCDVNQENDHAQETIFVQPEKPKEESELEITQIYNLGSDKEASWGQTIKIKLTVYKGGTDKKTINIWIENNNEEKASKQTSINLETKYLTTELTVLIQLKPNCDKKLKNGEYKITAEGLDTTTTKKIMISGENKETCQIIKEVIEKNVTKKIEKCEETKEQIQNTTVKLEKPKENKNYINAENTTKITGNIIYESKDQKAKNLGIYFYAAVLAMITIASILRK